MQNNFKMRNKTKHIKLFESFKSKSDMEYFGQILVEDITDYFGDVFEFDFNLPTFVDGEYILDIKSTGEHTREDIPSWLYRMDKNSKDFIGIEKLLSNFIRTYLSDSWKYHIVWYEDDYDPLVGISIVILDMSSVENIADSAIVTRMEYGSDVYTYNDEGFLEIFDDKSALLNVGFFEKHIFGTYEDDEYRLHEYDVCEILVKYFLNRYPEIISLDKLSNF